MKRENYIITCSNGDSYVKHKWNSAKRSIPEYIRGLIRESSLVYTLDKTEYTKDGGYFNYGTEVWNCSNGSSLIFTINKE